MTAGRTLAWVSPGTEGRRTRQTSPLFIGFALSGQTFDQLQGVSASSLSGLQFGLQLRRNFDRSVNDVDLYETSLGQGRVGHDNAVLDKAANDDRHGMAFLNHQRGW